MQQPPALGIARAAGAGGGAERKRCTLTTLNSHYGFSTSLLSFSSMTQPQITASPTPVEMVFCSCYYHQQGHTSSDLKSFVPTEDLSPQMPETTSLLISISGFGGSRSPFTLPQPHPPWLQEVGTLCPCAHRSLSVRATNPRQEAGKDPGGAEKGPRLWEPSHGLSVPIRRAIGLTGLSSVFICLSACVLLYLLMCLSLKHQMPPQLELVFLQTETARVFLPEAGMHRLWPQGLLPLREKEQIQLRYSTVLSSLHFSVPRMFNYIPTLFPKEFKAPVLCVFFAVALGGQAVVQPIGIQGH